MKGIYLGEFEELVLLMVGILNGNVYGIMVMDEIEMYIGWLVSVSIIYVILYCLEKKGFIEFFIGGVLVMWGGRSKCFYKIN